MKLKISLITVCIVFIAATTSIADQATFVPRLSVTEEYTDNLFLSPDNEQDDFSTIISPSFTAQVLGKSKGVSLFYEPSYTFYDENDDYNEWRHRVLFSGWTHITKHTRFNVSDSFLYTEDPLVDRDIAFIRTTNQPAQTDSTSDQADQGLTIDSSGTGLISDTDSTGAGTWEPEAQIDYTTRRTRKPYYTNSASVSIVHQFGENDSINLGYSHYLLENEDPDYEDNQRHNPNGGLTYWFLPQWGIKLDGSYTKGEFEVESDRDIWRGSASLNKKFTKHFEGYVRYSHSMVEYEESDEDDQTYNPSIGFNYTVARDISIELDVGYFTREYDVREDESGYSLDGRLVKRFKRGSLRLSGLGGYDYSFFGAEDNLGYSKFYEGSGSAGYQFTRHVSGNIFGVYRYDEYLDQTDREDDSIRAGVGMTIQPLQWLSFGLDYSYRTVDSTIDTNDYDENRFFLKISLFPPVPFKSSL